MSRFRRFVLVVAATAATLLIAGTAAVAQDLDLPAQGLPPQGSPIPEGQSDPPPAGPAAPEASQPEDDAVADDPRKADNTEARASQDEQQSAAEGDSVAESSQEGDRDCPDFGSQQDAQNFFEEQGGPDQDPDRLDRDDDGVACESLGAPTGGVDTGGGGTAVADSGGGGTAVADSQGPLGFILSGAALGLMFAGLARVAIRRRASA